nr:MAG TPA: hypothetical protein [Caudoviricetes sp.]
MFLYIPLIIMGVIGIGAIVGIILMIKEWNDE